NLLRGEESLDEHNHSPESLTPRRAIAIAVASRTRPIFMSTLTSVGGMLPLVLFPGSGSELYRGLGSVVVGGLITATLFTLLLIPLLLSLAFDLKAVLRLAPEGPKH
ncbi:MAG: efflux RND transporter permease subunit, partial [Planctomycetota bacterium]